MLHPGIQVRLVTALLVKNEADRYLARVLQRCQEFSDTVLVLDDRSSDGTEALAKSLGCQVRGRSILKGDAWGNEAPARAELWDWAVQEAQDGWILIADADMLLHGDPRPLTKSVETNAWAFILYDVWDESERLFRHDGYWKGHVTPRPWLVRPSTFGPDFVPQWPAKGVHPGHIPQNAPLVCGIAPPDAYWWLHLSYARATDRVAKRAAYRAVEGQLTEFERQHAESI